VNAVGLGGQRDIETVVDQEKRSVSLDERTERQRHIQQFPARGVLVTQLDRRRTGLKGRLGHCEPAPLARQLPVGDDHQAQGASELGIRQSMTT
jgi:hypothetical protein